jgi:hypothetical protein
VIPTFLLSSLQFQRHLYSGVLFFIFCFLFSSACQPGDYIYIKWSTMDSSTQNVSELLRTLCHEATNFIPAVYHAAKGGHLASR